jgi:hypothetical protein
MLSWYFVYLGATLIPIQIVEHPAFATFQVRSDVFRYPAQLFPAALFCYPALRVLDPSVEPKMRVPRSHDNLFPFEEVRRWEAAGICGARFCDSTSGSPFTGLYVGCRNGTHRLFK